jgi:hypothetical protein
MTIAREVSAVERGHIAHTVQAGPAFLPTFNRFILEGDGEFDAAQWQDAANQAAAVNVGLRLRMKGVLGWMRWETDGPAPRVHLLENCSWDGMTEQGMDFLMQPMDLRNGPLAEIFLLPGTPARAIFRTHHGIMDGLSTRIFVDDVFRILNGEKPLGASASLSDVDLARQYQIAPPITANANCLAIAGPATEVPPGYSIRRLILAKRVRNVIPKLLEKLAQFARQNNEGDGTVRLRVTVDCRRELPEDQRLISSNLTGLLFLDIDANTTERDIVKVMRNKLKAHEHLYFPKLGDLLKWIPLKLINRQAFAMRGQLHLRTRYTASGTVSSLGELEQGQLQCPGFITRHCFAIPIPFFMTPVFITVWGNPTGMDIVVGMPSSFGSDGRIEKLCAFLREELADA